MKDISPRSDDNNTSKKEKPANAARERTAEPSDRWLLQTADVTDTKKLKNLMANKTRRLLCDTNSKRKGGA